MTELNLYQVDAFTADVFGGNPACVIPLEEWLPDEQLLLLARENAVAETAFLSRREMDLHYAGLHRK
ncbi:PhzF family phenazine biosynthesis protein [Chitinophaga pinensis]|uniref:PhzF family phenazine biosynthesis protein n=1 Tax=Chitinophaga pinensis TaxID=79329 RepID=UPI0021BD6C06|nr:PhzF family phenazine biosynthesis protein [Chitinophaga pinensis]